MKSKGASSSLSKLALSNALAQNANEDIVNIPTKMVNSLLSEAIETSTVPTNLMRILFHEGKNLQVLLSLLMMCQKRGENPKLEAPKTTKGFY